VAIYLDEAIKLYNLPLQELLEKAEKVTAENFGNEVEFCSIISAKTGKCSENCRYCAQSSHYRTNIETHPLLSLEEVEKCARSARENGVSRFSLVTSGKVPDNEDFDKLLEMIRLINNIEGLQACVSIGILDEEKVKALKEAGLVRYHHNLNSCKSYYKDVCTTHTYEDRTKTLKLCQKHGIEICAGGIIGMGETRKQRVEMAFELAELNPVSVPVNFLHPVEGTPFEVHKDSIDEEEILRTLAVYRIILPKAVIRYAGGRASRFSKQNQELGIKAGVNGILVGNYLTTIGITPEEDLKLLEKIGKFLTV
jgi:biotin synthase